MQYQLYPHIIADPDILSGKPVVEGTHVPASTLIEQVASGKSLDEVARENGVSSEDVRAALNFGAQRAAEEVVLNDPLFSLAGMFDSGEPGWVDRHDDHLAEAYTEDHADE